MSFSVDEIDFLSPPAEEAASWGRPLSVSLIAHAALLVLILLTWTFRSYEALDPVRVLEINVMGPQDLALKGTGNDFTQGPLPEATAMAARMKDAAPVVAGNTSKLSRAIAAVAAFPAKLTPRGPLFGSGSGVGAMAGVGREKIYVAASATRPPRGGGSSGGGEGLVGTPGPAIDLRARRGGGAGSGGGSGSHLSGGAGSINGGMELQRRGESILAGDTSLSSGRIRDAAQRVALPPPPDSFFSIQGPLSRRKILAMKLPKYPRWAEVSGVEGQISVRLTVTAAGKVKPELFVEQTSGFPQLDLVALDALRGAAFAPLAQSEIAREEWGVATFNFKLKQVSGNTEDL